MGPHQVMNTGEKVAFASEHIASNKQSISQALAAHLELSVRPASSPNAMQMFSC